VETNYNSGVVGDTKGQGVKWRGGKGKEVGGGMSVKGELKHQRLPKEAVGSVKSCSP